MLLKSSHGKNLGKEFFIQYNFTNYLFIFLKIENIKIK